MSIFFIAVIFVFITGAVAGLFLQRRPKVARIMVHSFAIVASLLGGWFAINALLGTTPIKFSLPYSFASFAPSFYIDALAAFFILLICGAGVVVSIFALGYTTHYEHSHNIGLLGFLYNLFIASMVLVVAADSVIIFLVAWELMSVLSYFLVTYESENESALKAGFLYAVMTQIGTVFLLIAFFLFYKETGSFQFSDFRAAGSMMPQLIKDVIFLAALVGFGTKAGMVPLHTWLPEAHPAAPSHISALMSGVMIKVAIYGLLRFIFDLLGSGGAEVWWGVTLLVLGTLSAITGILYALMEQNIKRFLAYSSVENIGIILIGIGSAVLFKASGSYYFVGLALTAAMYHILSHTVFKSLLFMGAGAIHNATGLKDMEKMGGLAKVMPFTAMFFLVGSLTISALPPFTGFVSEWLVFQGLFYNLYLAGIGVKIIATVSVALLALTGALALSCFVKAFGITFLALPRSGQAEKAKEVGGSMLGGMSILAVLCLMFGLFPFIGLLLISPAVSALGLRNPIGSNWLYLTPLAHLVAGVSPVIIVMLFTIIILAVNVLAVLWWGRHKKRKAPTWACGRVADARMEYTAGSFVMPFRLIFSGIYRPTRDIERETLNGSRYLITGIHYKETIAPLFENYFYSPILSVVRTISANIRKIQSGNINAYLGYIFIVLIALLIIFA